MRDFYLVVKWRPVSVVQPAVCLGCDVKEITGSPDPKHISTSYVERQNLTMRMSMRRFTRLTKAFSKKVENHAAAIALYFMYYNFGRIHQTLRVTPAMEAGVANHIWSVGKSLGFSARLSRCRAGTVSRLGGLGHGASGSWRLSSFCWRRGSSQPTVTSISHSRRCSQYSGSLRRGSPRSLQS